MLTNQPPDGEVGRAGDSGQLMPWHAPPSATASAPGSVGPRSRVSSSTPIKPIGFEFLGEPSSATGDLQSEAPAFDLNSMASFGDLAQDDGNQETRSFYSYVVSLADENGEVYLGDFIQSFTKRTAARAFFNVLMCCNSGIMKANQKSAGILLSVTV